MRPAQSELAGTAPPATAASEIRAQVAPEHERQLPQPVRLISRTGKGKVRVQGLLGVGDFWAVFPWRLREADSLRRRVPTAVIRALPWTGAGPDPGVPPGWDEKNDDQQEIAL